MKKLKTAFFSHRSEVQGGGERSLLLLLSQINRRKIEPLLVVPGPGAISREAEELGINVHYVPMPPIRPQNISVFISSRRKIEALYRSENIDIAYFNTSRPMFYGTGSIARQNDVKTVWHCRVPERQHLLDPILVRHLDSIITISGYASERFNRYKHKMPIPTIYNGIDPEAFIGKNIAARKRKFLDHHSLRNKLLIGTAAVLQPRKKIDWMLQVISELNRTHDTNFLFIIAGKEPVSQSGYKEKLESQAARLGIGEKVRFLGQVDDMAAFYSSLHIYLHAGDREAFGRTLIESLACNTPIISPIWQATPEILRATPLAQLMQPEGRWKGDKVRIDNFPPPSIANHIKNRFETRKLRIKSAFPEKFLLSTHCREIEKFLTGLVNTKEPHREKSPASGKMKRKIAVDARELEKERITGIGRMLKRQLDHISETKPEWELVLIGDENTLFPDLKNKTERIMLPVKFRQFHEQVTLPRLLNRKRIKLYYSPYYKIPLRGGFKKIATLHDLTPIRAVTGLKRIFNHILFSTWVWLHLKSCTRLITDSQFSKNDLLRLYSIPDDKIAVVYPPFEPITKAGISMKHSTVLNFDVTKISYLLFVGGMRRHKNLNLLLKIFPEILKKSSAKIRLVAVGNWSEHDISHLSKYSFLTPVHNPDDALMSTLYENATALVMPSLYEGFGYPALEAMAAGTAVITTKQASLPEICENAAIYFDALNPESAIKPISQLLNDSQLRNEMEEAGKKQVEKFLKKDSLKQFLAVLDSTLLSY